MIVLSPRAVERLESHKPAWPMPKIFRMTKGGKLIEGIFKGETINTPSMLCVEDAIDGLKWMESLGGGDAVVQRVEGNLAAIAQWVERTPWVDFLAEVRSTRSSTSVCLKIVDPECAALPTDRQAALTKALSGLLEKERAGYDINGYRDAPPGLRIWAGPTVDTADLEALFPWLDWAFATVKAEQLKKG